MRYYLNSASIPEHVRRLAERIVIDDPGPEWKPYLDKVRHNAHKVLDSDAEKLRAAGHSDDRIFEVTVATALEEGLRRLTRGLAAIDEARR